MGRFNTREAQAIILGKKKVADSDLAICMQDSNMDTAGSMLQMWVQVQILRQLELLNSNIRQLGQGKGFPGRPRKD